MTCFENCGHLVVRWVMYPAIPSDLTGSLRRGMVKGSGSAENTMSCSKFKGNEDLRPTLNEKLFPVHRPSGLKRADWNFFS